MCCCRALRVERYIYLTVLPPWLGRKFLNFPIFLSFQWPAVSICPNVTVPQTLLLLAFSCRNSRLPDRGGVQTHHPSGTAEGAAEEPDPTNG